MDDDGTSASLRGNGSEPEDVLREWQRIVRWAERNAPEAFAALAGPGDPAHVDAAQQRMDVDFPPDLRAWLGASRLGRRSSDAGRNTLVASGADGLLPDGSALLGITDIERVHASMTSVQESLPPDGECVLWCRWWVPIAAECDGFHGRFLDTRTGRIGAWREGDFPSTDVHPSLFAFLRTTADALEGSTTAAESGPHARSGRSPEDRAVRAWARANGHPVNDRGRIPHALREAWRAAGTTG